MSLVPVVRHILFTTAEVAEVFGVDVQTVRRWEQAGRITCVRLPSGLRRFRREDIEAFLPDAFSHENGAA